MWARIICAVAERDTGTEATIRFAADLALRHQLPLEVVDIEAPAPPVIAASAPSMAPAGLDLGVDYLERERLRSAARRRENHALVARAAGAGQIVIDSVVAPEAEALRALSRRPDAMMLVARDRGGGPMRSKLTGNAVRETLRELHCPIVVLPDAFDGALSPSPMVVCAVDDDEFAVAVAAFAGTLACELGAPVRVVHVGEQTGAARRFEHLTARCRAVMPADADVTFDLLFGPAPAVVAAEVERSAADLAVVGAPRHGAIGSALRGSVGHDLIDGGTAPVVVVPDAVRAAGR